MLRTLLKGHKPVAGRFALPVGARRGRKGEEVRDVTEEGAGNCVLVVYGGKHLSSQMYKQSVISTKSTPGQRNAHACAAACV